MRNPDDLFLALSQSRFRAKFTLTGPERVYMHMRGRATVRAHAEDFIARRLSAALPINDGKQTPMRGHPVFVAQHATATCCRGCLEKWHGIPRGRPLTAEQRRYLVGVIDRWLREQVADAPELGEPTLFDLE